MVPAGSETFRSLTLSHTADGCVRCSSLACNCCPQLAALTTTPAKPTYKPDRLFIAILLRFPRPSVRLSFTPDIHCESYSLPVELTGTEATRSLLSRPSCPTLLLRTPGTSGLRVPRRR